MAGKKNFERLPSSVMPLVYDLFLTPDLSNFTFRGEEVITLEVRYAYVFSIHPTMAFTEYEY